MKMKRSNVGELVLEYAVHIVALMLLVGAVTVNWQAIIQGLATIYSVTGIAIFVMGPMTVLLLARVAEVWTSGNWSSRAVANLCFIKEEAPPLGLLGTVFGLIVELGMMGGAQAGVTETSATMDGISLALYSTLWGGILASIAGLTLRFAPSQTDSSSGMDVSQVQDRGAPDFQNLKSEVGGRGASIEKGKQIFERGEIEVLKGKSDESSGLIPLLADSSVKPGLASAPAFPLVQASPEELVTMMGEPLFACDAVFEAFCSRGISGLKLKVRQRPVGIKTTIFEAEMPSDHTLAAMRAVTDDVGIDLGATSVRIEPDGQAGKVRIVVEAESAPEVPSTLYQALKRPDISAVLDKGGKRILLGQTVTGQPVTVDLVEENLLIGGTSGSGKSNTVNQVMISLVTRHSLDSVEIFLCDSHGELLDWKSVEQVQEYAGDTSEADRLLDRALQQMESRYQLFAEVDCATLTQFNQSAIPAGRQPLPLLVLILEELAAITTRAGTMKKLECLAQEGRKAGIRLIAVTQAPRVGFISGPMKANLQARFCHATTSPQETRQVLDATAAAHELTQPGEGILKCRETLGRAIRVRAFHADRDFINHVQSHWH